MLSIYGIPLDELPAHRREEGIRSCPSCCGDMAQDDEDVCAECAREIRERLDKAIAADRARPPRKEEPYLCECGAHPKWDGNQGGSSWWTCEKCGRQWCDIPAAADRPSGRPEDINEEA